ncbi:uncharacterized protein LOC119339495 [Triticum dicoccoides]|uniref:uncharacterized protein LOC119339495 n=1 Tax=Triticum dicoccoides TaxID=85692 RepID=UPI001891DE1E|nr:uncharacterized protein LOC119339495 [Triticum dicoccoides]
MDAGESSTSPYSPPSLSHKLRTTVRGCFGSPSSPESGGERPHSGGRRTRWRRRAAAAGEFRYDPLSYALNFDEGGSDAAATEAEDTAFRYRNFSSRLPPSPVPASRAVAIVGNKPCLWQRCPKCYLLAVFRPFPANALVAVRSAA